MPACNLIISQLIGARVQANVHVQMATHTAIRNSTCMHACVHIPSPPMNAALTHTYVYVYAGAEQTLKDFQK